MVAISHDYNVVNSIEFFDGRYFTPEESAGGRPVAIIGDEISRTLFQNADPLGKKIKVFGQQIEVIGLLKKEGEKSFGNSNDNQVLIPINLGRNFIDLKGDNIGAAIMVRAKPMVSNEELADELTGIMRSVRKLKPGVEDDFSINETSVITQGFDQLFNIVAIVGWIIGGFSLLVGGFGIANIMFVSVKRSEPQYRYPEIDGGQKLNLFFSSFCLKPFSFPSFRRNGWPADHLYHYTTYFRFF